MQNFQKIVLVFIFLSTYITSCGSQGPTSQTKDIEIFGEENYAAFTSISLSTETGLMYKLPGIDFMPFEGLSKLTTLTKEDHLKKLKSKLEQSPVLNIFEQSQKRHYSKEIKAISNIKQKIKELQLTFNKDKLQNLESVKEKFTKKLKNASNDQQSIYMQRISEINNSIKIQNTESQKLADLEQQKTLLENNLKIIFKAWDNTPKATEMKAYNVDLDKLLNQIKTKGFMTFDYQEPASQVLLWPLRNEKVNQVWSHPRGLFGHFVSPAKSMKTMKNASRMFMIQHRYPQNNQSDCELILADNFDRNQNAYLVEHSLTFNGVKPTRQQNIELGVKWMETRMIWIANKNPRIDRYFQNLKAVLKNGECYGEPIEIRNTKYLYPADGIVPR